MRTERADYVAAASSVKLRPLVSRPVRRDQERLAVHNLGHLFVTELFRNESRRPWCSGSRATPTS